MTFSSHLLTREWSRIIFWERVSYSSLERREEKVTRTHDVVKSAINRDGRRITSQTINLIELLLNITIIRCTPYYYYLEETSL